MDKRMDAKIKALKNYGALNPRPEGVTDDLFAGSEFFDPRDLVLVKYEMLRRVRVEGYTVARAAAAFGFSRVAFYQIKAAYERGGLPALIPKHRGPKQAHKITDTVLGFIDKWMVEDKALRPPALVKRIRKKFGFSVHPRSIERSLSRRQKKGQDYQPIKLDSNFNQWTSRFEYLRRTALSEYQSSDGNWGIALFVRQGMAAWMHAWPQSPIPAINVSRYQIVDTAGTFPELSSPLRTQITMLLADMILNRSYQEAML